MFNRKLLVMVCSILLMSILGCGQKGPLYEKPEQPKNNPTEQESK